MEGKRTPKLLIADDNVNVRSNFVSILEAANLDVVAEAGDGREAMELVRELRPDLVLMDARMPVMDGIEATREIKRAFPDTAILILTASEDPEYLLSALDAGAAGYILKHAEPDGTVRAARAAMSGGHPLDSELSSAVIRTVARGGRAAPAVEAIHIWMLGGFSVSVGGRDVGDSEWRRKAGSLVRRLALANGRRLHREHAASLLWPELDPKSQAGSFHRALHFAWKILAPTKYAL